MISCGEGIRTHSHAEIKSSDNRLLSRCASLVRSPNPIGLRFTVNAPCETAVNWMAFARRVGEILKMAERQ